MSKVLLEKEEKIINDFDDLAIMTANIGVSFGNKGVKSTIGEGGYI